MADNTDKSDDKLTTPSSPGYYWAKIFGKWQPVAVGWLGEIAALSWDGECDTVTEWGPRIRTPAHLHADPPSQEPDPERRATRGPDKGGGKPPGPATYPALSEFKAPRVAVRLRREQLGPEETHWMLVGATRGTPDGLSFADVSSEFAAAWIAEFGEALTEDMSDDKPQALDRVWWLNLESIGMGRPVLGVSELVRRGYAAHDPEQGYWHITRPGLMALGIWLAEEESLDP